MLPMSAITADRNTDRPFFVSLFIQIFCIDTVVLQLLFGVVLNVCMSVSHVLQYNLQHNRQFIEFLIPYKHRK